MPFTIPFSVTALHGVLASGLIASLALTSLELARSPEVGSTGRAAKACGAALVAALLVNAAGAVGYVVYRLADPSSPKSIILKTHPWAHKVLFENMEYVALVIPLVIAVCLATIAAHGPRLVTDERSRTWTERMIYLALALVLVTAIAGFIPSLIAFVK